MTTKSVKTIAGIYFLPVICIATSSGLLVLMDWLCNNFFKNKISQAIRRRIEMITLAKRWFVFLLVCGSFFGYFYLSDFSFLNLEMLPREVSERANEIITTILLGISLLIIFVISLWIDRAWREKCSDWFGRFLEKVMRCNPPDDRIIS
ncbi:MAG TPA: hypothetical protein DEA46_03200 [Candidatus Moranbacteria bacterium]|nr:hypothetical protein [Candidatus Moranbacteria bacterium]